MLPTTDLRQNVLTLAIPDDRLPAVGYMMRRILPPEEYDNEFQGQYLKTTYFDTRDFKLRKARLTKDKYCTVRIRAYAATQQPGIDYPASAYAISAKTKEEKYRQELDTAVAETLVRRGLPDGYTPLPGHMAARLMELTDGEPLVPVVTVCFTRYAVEDSADRITLDCEIRASNGKIFPTNILENKTTAKPAKPLPELLALGYAPVRLSKFLWATTYGVR
jgi:hypothetical protein